MQEGRLARLQENLARSTPADLVAYLQFCDVVREWLCSCLSVSPTLHKKPSTLIGSQESAQCGRCSSLLTLTQPPPFPNLCRARQHAPKATPGLVHCSRLSGAGASFSMWSRVVFPALSSPLSLQNHATLGNQRPFGLQRHGEYVPPLGEAPCLATQPTLFMRSLFVSVKFAVCDGNASGHFDTLAISFVARLFCSAARWCGCWLLVLSVGAVTQLPCEREVFVSSLGRSRRQLGLRKFLARVIQHVATGFGHVCVFVFVSSTFYTDASWSFGHDSEFLFYGCTWALTEPALRNGQRKREKGACKPKGGLHPKY